MTPAERLAERIAKNKEINQRAAEVPAKPAKTTSARSSRKATTTNDVAIAARQSAVRNQLDQFQKIKNQQGIDAASDFILSRIKK